MSEWQPIETAPKDGGDLLLWQPGAECSIVVGRWQSFTDADTGEQSSWWAPADSLISDVCGSLEDVSHWMPLPSPPQTEAGEK